MAHKASCFQRSVAVLETFPTLMLHQIEATRPHLRRSAHAKHICAPAVPRCVNKSVKRANARVSRGSRTRKGGEGAGRVTSHRERKHLQPPLATITLPCSGTDRPARTTDGTNDARQKRSSRRGPLGSHRERLGSLNDGSRGRGWV